VPTSTKDTSFTKTSEGNEPSSTYTFTSDGVIVSGGANFWPRKGGENVTVKLNSDTIETFTAQKGADGYRWNIPHSSKIIPVTAGDIIKIESTYHNPFTEPVKDASGMYGFYYAPQINIGID
jgi:hypothetical protein